jgi:outer membrane protein assembly factor BamB
MRDSFLLYCVEILTRRTQKTAQRNAEDGLPSAPFAKSPASSALKKSDPLFTALALVLGALMAFCSSASAIDWHRWRGPDLNGISKETGWSTTWPKDGPKQLWKASVGIGFSSVSVSQGRLFTLGNRDGTDTVFCFDAENGKELWKHSYECPLDAKYYEGGPGSTPTVDGDNVFTLSKRGHLFCFEAASGKVVWQKDLLAELGVKKPEWGFAGSPLVEGDLLILNLAEAGTAVDKRTGQVVWTSGKDMAGYATPVPLTSGAERAVALFSSKALVGVRVKDGKELWRYAWVERWSINNADPILMGNQIFISTFGRGCALLKLGAGTPTVVWENKNMGNHFNSCVLLDSYLYGIDGNTDRNERDLRCLDATTGEVKWKYNGLGLGSLIAANGKLIVLSEKGELVIAEASPKAFQPIARAQVLGGKCWTAPVLSNGRIYGRNAQGTLVCLDVKASPATASK